MSTKLSEYDTEPELVLENPSSLVLNGTSPIQSDDEPSIPEPMSPLLSSDFSSLNNVDTLSPRTQDTSAIVHPMSRESVSRRRESVYTHTRRPIHAPPEPPQDDDTEEDRNTDLYRLIPQHTVQLDVDDITLDLHTVVSRLIDSVSSLPDAVRVVTNSFSDAQDIANLKSKLNNIAIYSVLVIRVTPSILSARDIEGVLHCTQLGTRALNALEALRELIADSEDRLAEYILKATDEDSEESYKEALTDVFIPTLTADLESLRKNATIIYADLESIPDQLDDHTSSVRRAMEPTRVILEPDIFESCTTVVKKLSQHDTNCPICLCSISDEESGPVCKINACGHMGHESCFRTMFTQKCTRPICPICRTDVRDGCIKTDNKDILKLPVSSENSE